MFCRKCGAPLLPDDEFCSKCGAKVIRDDDAGTSQQQAAAPAQFQSQQSSQSQQQETDDIGDILKDPNLLSEATATPPSKWHLAGGIVLIALGIGFLHDIFDDPLKDTHLGVDLFFLLLVPLFIMGGIALIHIWNNSLADKACYDKAVASHKNPMPYIDVKKIALRHPITGLVKRCNTGYSWGTFFLNCLWPLIRGDIKWFVISGFVTTLLGLVSVGILGVLAGPAFGFFYNKKYIKELIEKGYPPADILAKKWLEREDLLIKYPKYPR